MSVDATEVLLQIWDTAGQERFNSITHNYLKGAMGVVIVFDLTEKSSFTNIQSWVTTVKTNTGEVPNVLIGNKSDLENERKITSAEAESKAKELGIKYFETSAQNGKNVEEAFFYIARDIKTALINQMSDNTVTLQGKKTGNSGSCSC